jgi:hypothetical protein
MYPTVQYQIAKAQVADMHNQAQRGAMGRTARQVRSARKHQSGHGTPRFTFFAARRVLTALGARA